MNRSSYLFGHFLRSSLLPVALIFAFSFSLYQTSTHLASPGKRQKVGWQAWDVVQYAKQANEQVPLASDDKTNSSTSSSASSSSGGSFAPSYDLDKWDPLIPHTTGLTEITVRACYLPAWLYPSACTPPTTPEDDKLKGRWVRVERDLNAKSGLWYLNAYYRRTRRFDAPLITDVRWLEDGASPPKGLDLSQYTMASGDWRDGVWPKQKKMRLWYKTTERGRQADGWWKRRQTKGADRRRRRQWRHEASREESWDEWDAGGSTSTSSAANEPEDELLDDAGFSSGESDEIITEIDILYGDGPPMYGFERVRGGPMLAGGKGKKWDSVDLVVRKGNPIAPYASTLRFSTSGEFKIMQIADLHYSVSSGKCRDTSKSPCEGDSDTAQLIAQALDAEKPDIVVFSGDQLNGQDTSYDAKSVIAKYAQPVIDRKIPWAMIFGESLSERLRAHPLTNSFAGNHDSEIADDRAEQMRFVQSMPYALSEPGPARVDGVGNYLLKLYSGDASYQHIFSLYFLDSHSYQPKKLPWARPDYDYLKPSQIDWFLNTSEAIKPIERPFTPDGADDLGKIWARGQRAGVSRLPRTPAINEDGLNNKILAKPNAMMFFHIPIAESYGPVDTDQLSGESLDIGTQLEGDGPGGSKTNGHFYENGLKKAMEIPQQMIASGEADSYVPRSEVKVVAHGHCHNTDKCRRVGGIWFCFNGGSSYSGYGSIGFPRRFRIYQISDHGETVVTYKRTEDDQVIDREVLVGNDSPKGLGRNPKMSDRLEA